uniref:Phosphopantetheine-binding n=1 Tax=Cyanothece sp. (strain PCC 7425 / ATCC 29141) TaxID=395961 RepID=B8HKY8_CYAP4
MELKSNTYFNSEEIQVWLINYIATLLKIDQAEVDPQKPFREFGMDSMTALGMLGDLSDFLGCEDLEASVLYKYTTIEKLSQYLAAERRRQ